MTSYVAIDHFGTETLTAIPPEEKPTYNSLKIIHQELNANAMTIAETNRLFAANEKQFLIFRGTETALKKQLLEAVSDTFTKTLKHKMYGYAQVTAREILAHLDAAYGTVDADDIKDNEERMNATWNPSQPIEDLYNQVKDAQKFAADHDGCRQGKTPNPHSEGSRICEQSDEPNHQNANCD
ncbi:hypothetical protein SEMRO_179_G078600.1 [Seminavis robusta]|uniref:Uncharacterized protein n=1 Tax=Seminavis robusta TaxID=568900 RepID=A0A9N8H8S5_9STRA|nr:hypothetical protein SEMRO_179_G078600.1 [Seminavis robusta]|eukprot:Sro179_g078600.1 n/a (182) ;mRNA; f:86889-87434